MNFPNKKIFRLIKQKRRKYGYGPWETEIYGNGEIFRKKYFYPSFLPMYVGCDHGVNWGSKLRPNEIKNNFDYFFTYNKQKLKKINNKKIFKAINNEHPWIFYNKQLTVTLFYCKSFTSIVIRCLHKGHFLFLDLKSFTRHDRCKTWPQGSSTTSVPVKVSKQMEHGMAVSGRGK